MFTIALLFAAAAGPVMSTKSTAQATTAPSTASISGDWRGELSPAPRQSIPLVLHIKGAPGAWKATLDSPSQNASGLAITSLAQNGNQVTFAMDMLNASYVGTVSSDGSTLKGKWSQGGGSLPLTLTRVAAGSPVTAAARPQTPKPPFPYAVEDVGYENQRGKAHLAGTLTLPRGKGPFPAVLLISGSGLQDRDESIFGHKPFLVWADNLTRRGIAVLRVDDRQVGSSTGEVHDATTADFVTDAQSGIDYLRSRGEIDSNFVGLLGHSEGAIIAPIVASLDPSIAFIVLLAGLGQTGEQMLLQQKRLIETAAGASPDLVDRSVSVNRKLFDAVKRASDTTSAKVLLAAAWRDIARDAGSDGADEVPDQINAIATPWMRWILNFDPKPTLERVRCPILAVAGSKDIQVPPAENLAEIRQAVSENKNATIVELSGLNHLLQTAKSGYINEYTAIEETVSPLALKLVGDWIEDHVELGSGLIGHSQKMTVAARATAEKKTVGHRS